MSAILHLSDLHLGDADAWERQTDEKVDLVPRDENARITVIKTGLAAVQRHLTDEGLDLDLVAVSGDLTSQHASEGFERFKQIVQETQLVDLERVVVVPGNHDVDWNSDSATGSKYASFLASTRAIGMTTPLCDGVDLTAEPDDVATNPIIDLQDCLVVAINSANWCGVTVGKGRRAQTYDVARVSEAQLERLTELLRDYEGHDGIRLALLHHHLLPVTEDEEVKPFESFTNLARLRGWLRAHGFHAVLHGHKHRAAVTWDHVYGFDRDDDQGRRILVASAPAPTTWGAPIFRLLKVGSATGRKPVVHAPRLVLDTIRAERSERPLRVHSKTYQLDSGPVGAPGLVAIDAPTADAAYERLVDEFARRPGKLLNVTCVVRDPESAEQLPTNFVGEIEDPESWLGDAVDWWQKAAPALVAAGDAPFNHGERLYSTGPDKGALDLAADRLGSSTAMVLLVRNPELRPGSKAPAFVAVQLVRAADEAGERLDCVGYFRKQDLTLWWPVNIAELRAIQRHVLDLLTVEGLDAGRLVTIAVEAIHDDVLPQLTGTRVDRLVDLRPERLLELAYAVAHSPPAKQDDVHQDWLSTLSDIGGTRDFPSLGIERLLDHLRVFDQAGSRNDVKAVIERLERVYDRAHRAEQSSSTSSAREAHSHDLFRLTGEVLEAVQAALEEPEEAEG